MMLLYMTEVLIYFLLISLLEVHLMYLVRHVALHDGQ
jgi:hypothetical protein